MDQQATQIALNFYLLKDLLRIRQSDKYRFKNIKTYGINFLFLILTYFLSSSLLYSQQIREITSYQEFPWEELGAKDIDPKIFIVMPPI
ncbi:MAG: hypothetical protein K0M45_06815 [Candidatus Paracaedibacteraceae bacterium]|nr:hypothetical protein [Candidatus Paracaedibacteraceae bacterium]